MCEISLCYACRELLSDAFDVMVAEPALFKGKCDNCNKRNALEKCVVVKKRKVTQCQNGCCLRLSRLAFMLR